MKPVTITGRGSGSLGVGSGIDAGAHDHSLLSDLPVPGASQLYTAGPRPEAPGSPEEGQAVVDDALIGMVVGVGEERKPACRQGVCFHSKPMILGCQEAAPGARQQARLVVASVPVPGDGSMLSHRPHSLSFTPGPNPALRTLTSSCSISTLINTNSRPSPKTPHPSCQSCRLFLSPQIPPHLVRLGPDGQGQQLVSQADPEDRPGIWLR